MPDVRIEETGPTVAEAFAALPLESPDRSAWPVLAARIDGAAPRRVPVRRRWLLAVSAAAAIGAVALLPRPLPDPAHPPGDVVAAAMPSPAAAAPALDELMAESARLDYLLQAVSGDEVASGAATALSLEYESRVQQIDSALSDPTLAADDRIALWHRRVELLREYAGVQGTTQWLAAEGKSFDGDLVAVF